MKFKFVTKGGSVATLGTSKMIDKDTLFLYIRNNSINWVEV